MGGCLSSKEGLLVGSIAEIEIRPLNSEMHVFEDASHASHWFDGGCVLCRRAIPA